MRFHTSLPVRNIEETISFYCVLFGVEPVKTKTDYAKFLPPGLSLNISFHEQADALLKGVHLGIELPDEKQVTAAYKRLEAAGLPLQTRETSICCYANQDKFWVTDPSGYEWEIYTLLEDTEKKIDRDTTCCGGPEVRATDTDASQSCCA